MDCNCRFRFWGTGLVFYIVCCTCCCCYLCLEVMWLFRLTVHIYGNLEVDNCFQTLVRGNSCWFKCNKMIVCLDFVYDLVGLYLRFVLFPWIETSEMKLAACAQLATAAILPSPVLLWRLKVPCLSFILLCLCVGCTIKRGCIWRSVFGTDSFVLINLNLIISFWLLVECGCAFCYLKFS